MSDVNARLSLLPRSPCVFARRYLASSMVSGLCVTTAMNPLDVISTRLYTQGTGVAERYTGPLDCAAKTIKAEGLRGVSVRGSSKESKNHGGDSDSLLRLVGIPSWFGWYYIAFFVLAMLASNYASAPAPAFSLVQFHQP